MHSPFGNNPLGVILGTVAGGATVIVLALGGVWLWGQISRPGTPPPPVGPGPAPTAVVAPPVQPTPGPSAPGGGQPGTGVGGSAAPNSHWLGTLPAVTGSTTGPTATGVAANGNVPLDVPAGMTVVVEAYQLGDENGANLKTGPGIACIAGPFKRTIWVHDGQVHAPVPSANALNVVRSIEQNWAVRPVKLVPQWKPGC